MNLALAIHVLMQAHSSVHTKTETLPALALPLAAFVTGSLSGLFGIGGGLLLNPVLLQIGIPPQVYRDCDSACVFSS